MSICHRTVNYKKNLKCTLRCSNMSSTNHQWTLNLLSSTLHGLNTHFIHHPSNVENYSIGHKSETDQSKQNKKIRVLENIFLHLYTGFGLKNQNTKAENRCLTFWTCVKSTLNGPPNGPVVTYSKIQNRLSRPP